MSTATPSVTKTPLILVDFDQTITKHDTIRCLGQFGISQTQHQKPWSYFVDGYMQDYRHHRDQLKDVPNSFKSFVEQLDSYRPIERASLKRVSDHKVFQGITRYALKEQAIKLSKTELQVNIISTLKQYKEQVRIVSLNWSKDWILGFTHELGLTQQQIYSNDLDFRDDVCTGDIIPHILTAGDKQQLIHESIKRNQKVIYIGDSLGDIEALVEANTGIIIGNDQTLIKSLSDFGYTVEEDISKPSHLYRVDHWDQIKTILDTI